LAALYLVLVIAPEPYFVQITFLGDVMLGRGIAQIANRTKNWQPFAVLQPVINSSDFTAANLESPLTISPIVTKGYALCAPPTQVTALQAARFHLLTLANNHIYDCGESGLNQTRSTLQSAGLNTAGPELQPVFINKHGQRFAFLALDDISSAVDIAAVTQVLHSSARQADWVIVTIHWGSEYQPAPSSRQRLLAAAFINAGADVIIGHHPHVIQPNEKITSSERKKDGLVFYSLGNALFDQQSLPDTRTGEMVSLFFSTNGSMWYSEQRFETDPRTAIIRTLIP
jgi:poly-gamma-glutamate synthesis protein (capsule biosynthesis protein)